MNPRREKTTEMIPSTAPFQLTVERGGMTKRTYRVVGDLEGEFVRTARSPSTFELTIGGEVAAVATEQDVDAGESSLRAMARAAAGAYELRDADGASIGVVAVDPKGVLLRSRMTIELADGRRISGVERSASKAFGRRAWGLMTLVVDVPNPVRSPVVFTDPAGVELFQVDPLRVAGTAQLHVTGQGQVDLVVASFAAVLLDSP